MMISRRIAPAKINLFLEVGAPKGGFHPLISLVDIVNLYDVVEIREAEKTNISFFSKWDIPAQNTVSESVKLLKREFGLKGEFDIKIFKNIPPGSGLGGGSSDAATIFTTLSKYCNVLPDKAKLIKISSLVGKDVPLFILGKRCIIENFGEEVNEVFVDQPLSYIVFTPDFSVSTKDVYSNLDKMGIAGNLTIAKRKIKIILDLLEKKNTTKIEEHIENRLSYSCFNLHPKIKEVKKIIEEQMGKNCFVSGSGGSLFAIFKTKEEAEEKAQKLEIAGWKSFVACSIITS